MTTYVLGAGASRHVGYPFAKSMGVELFEWMDNHEPVGPFNFRQAAASIRTQFPNIENIEDLLTQIEEAIKTRASSPIDPYSFSLPNHDKPALLLAMREWFSEIRSGRATAYELFAQKVLKPGDCVLTFNYDTSLDRELVKAGLWQLGDGYGFDVEGFDAGTTVRLLKLHGSMNWLAILFGGLQGSFSMAGSNSLGNRPVFTDPELSFLGFQGRDPKFPRSGAPAIRTLILPARCKQFYLKTSFGREWEHFWNDLWDKAADALRKSDEVVICGYGIMAVDERACELLLEGKYSGRVEVCCGSDTEQIVQRFTGHDAQAAQHFFFEEWVQSRTS